MTPTPVVFSDLDGTLYVGDELVPGAPEAVTRLRNMGCTLRFLTNTDTVPPQTLQETLRERGFDVRVGEVFTPYPLPCNSLKQRAAGSTYCRWCQAPCFRHLPPTATPAVRSPMSSSATLTTR
ncbi:hypothetical protein [Mycobacterium avium]|uniref:hypothetical protein n=1 Tax=Mycobacterium avium TaxID=1764 RepID=UPI0009B82E00